MDKKAFGAAVAVAGKKSIDPTVVTQAVDDWLEAHPEATTTVQDGAISYQKLDSTLKGKMDDVGNLKTAFTNDSKSINGIVKGVYLKGTHTAKEEEALSRIEYIYADGTVDLTKYRIGIIAKTETYQRIILFPQDTSKPGLYLDSWNNNICVFAVDNAYTGTGNIYCKYLWGDNETTVNRVYSASPFRFSLPSMQEKITKLYDTVSQKANSDLPGVPSPFIQLLDIDNEENVYDNAKVFNDLSKSYSNGVITFTAAATASATNKGQGVIYGATSTPVDDYVQNDNVPEKLTVEFDYSASNIIAVRIDTKANTNQTVNVAEGTNEHAKITFNNVGSVKYLQLFFGYASETISIWNLKLYYGTDFDSTVYEFAVDTYEKMNETYEAPLYKKMISIGDSLTNYCIWQPYAAKLVKAKLYSRVGISGSSIANTGESSIYANVQNMTADPDVDLVTVWGGTNDWHSNITIGDFNEQLNPLTRNTGTFYGGYIGIVEKLMTIFPKARIILIGTTPRSENNNGDNYQNQTNASGKYLRDFVDAVKVVAEYYGFPFLDLLRNSGINVLNITQYMEKQGTEGAYYYLHLNDWGTKMIGIQIGHFINAIGR